MLLNLIKRNLNGFARNKLFIGGNWKSNNTLQESKNIVSTIVNNLKYNPNNVGTTFIISDVIISPINIQIPAVQQELKHPNVKIAAQNSSNYNFGAYTG